MTSKDNLLFCRSYNFDGSQFEPVFPIKPPDFKPYQSIENHTKSKYLDFIRSNFDLSKTLFIASEKIDGTNFALYIKIDHKYHVYHVFAARRRSLLLEKESFYNFQVLVNDHKNHINIMVLNLIYNDEIKKDTESSKEDISNKDEKLNLSLDDKELEPENPVLEIIIRGELHGGYYPGRKANTKAVFTRVAYTNEKRIIVFDVEVKTKKKTKSVDYDEMIQLMKDYPEQGLSFNMTPERARGTLDELLNLDPVFESQVHQIYKYYTVPNNLAEGYVIRPFKPIYLENDTNDLLLVKLKNPSFGD